ncbi:MAG: hypothetical protein IJ001_03045 [Oscillospiraceae bacterium]|nr:hypothetical protein [Oscillospiraceae bacterium]
MREENCKDCRYFLQHYTLNERQLFRVYCGHCTYGRIKRKHPDTRACEHFVQGVDDREAFVDREFLSKALLQYALELELLPEILGPFPEGKKPE